MTSFYNQSVRLNGRLTRITFEALTQNKFIFDTKLKNRLLFFFSREGLTASLARGLINRLEIIYNNKVVSVLKKESLNTPNNIKRVLREGLSVEVMQSLGIKDFNIRDRKRIQRNNESNFTLAGRNYLKAGVIERTLQQSKQKFDSSPSFVLVLYLPSSADNNRLAHERYYNTVMTLRRCARIQNVPNCQCGYVVLGTVKRGVFAPKGSAYTKYRSQIRRLGVRVND